jgi:hypothetical protein
MKRMGGSLGNAARRDDGVVTALHDPGLPRLGQALDAGRMAPRLHAVVGGHGALAARVLKHASGKRCVIAYEFEDGRRAVGKLYRKDRARVRAAELVALGDGLGGAIRVPRVLACWEDLGLVLQEWVPGAGVPDYEELGERAELVLQLAAALADFHGSPVRIGPAASLATHVRRTCRPGIAALAAALPELAATLRDIESAMYAREAAIPSVPGPCHGDFGPRQVLVDGANVYLVDLDGFCQGDPGLDVASFRVGLVAHLGETGGALADRFLAAYLARRGLAALPTLAHHEAFCELRRALILWRKRPQGWETDLQRTVERGRSRL